MPQYYPYKKDLPKYKYFITTKDKQRIYFGASGYSDFTIHMDEARKQRYINRHEKMKTGLNKELTLPVFGQGGCYGIKIPFKIVIEI